MIELGDDQSESSPALSLRIAPQSEMREDGTSAAVASATLLGSFCSKGLHEISATADNVFPSAQISFCFFISKSWDSGWRPIRARISRCEFVLCVQCCLQPEPVFLR